MKGKIFISGACLSAVIALASCSEDSHVYSDAEYIMFADTMSVNVVLQGSETFSVPVVSTVTCDYDRTFGVEIVDSGSTAIEGRDYTISSNMLTIKAGENRADVIVSANLDNLPEMDTLQFNLRLVAPESVKWDLYGDQTKVRMFKVRPFSIDEFTGWCMENTVVLTNWLHDGYDVTIKMDPSDPAEPSVTMDPDQVISNEQNVLGQINADDRIYVEESSNAYSYFNTCRNSVILNVRVYLQEFGAPFATLGYYDNQMEWVSDEEADRLVKEYGMVKKGGPSDTGAGE